MRKVGERTWPLEKLFAKEGDGLYPPSAQKYVDILKMAHLPQAPEELPLNVRVPPDILGFLPTFMQLPSDVEHSQTVFIDVSGSTTSTAVHQGNKTSTSIAEVVATWGKQMQIGDKPVMGWHTHPDYSACVFSGRDIVIARKPTSPYIYVTAHRGAICALMQTAQLGDIVAKPGFTSILREQLRDAVKDFGYVRKFDQIPTDIGVNTTMDILLPMAQGVNGLGLEMYLSIPQDMTKGFTPNDFSNGLNLTKITAESLNEIFDFR